MPDIWHKPKSFKHGLELIEKNLAWLDFSMMKLTNDNVDELLTLAEERDSIVKLRLGENLIGDPGAVRIGKYIADTKSLEELELSNNSISCDGLHAICSGLEKNSSLTKITLAKNHIKNKGAAELADVVAHHKTLNYIKLDNNYLTEESIYDFIQALRQNPNVVYLHFNGPAIRKEEELRIVESLLKRNKELKFEAQRKQQNLLRTLNTAHKAKAPWRRSRLMVIGEGRTGKSALVRSLLDQPFDPNLQSTIVGQVNEVNVRSRGWGRLGEDNIPIDNSLSLAMSIACNQYDIDFKKREVYKEEEAKMKALNEEQKRKQEKERKEKEMVEAFKKNPAKFRKLSAAKKRELRDMMQRVKNRENTKVTSVTKPFKVNAKPKEEVTLEEPEPEKRDVELSALESLQNTITTSKTQEDKPEGFQISAEDFRKLSPEQKRAARAKMKAMRKKKVSTVVNTLNQKQLNGLLNNGDAFRNVARNLPKLKLSIWDLGGQNVFHTVHHLFVTNFAMYVMVFDMQQFDTEEVAEEVSQHLKYWSRTLNLHAPSCKVFIVGTFLDKIELKSFENDVDIVKVLARINMNVGAALTELNPEHIVKNEKDNLMFFPVDNRNHHGVTNLKRVIETTGEDQKFVNLPVELRWLSILDELLDLNNQRLKKVKLHQTQANVEELGMRLDDNQVAVLPDNNNPPAPPNPVNAQQPPINPVNIHQQPPAGGALNVQPPVQMPTDMGTTGTGIRMVDLVNRMKEKQLELFQGWVSFGEVYTKASKLGISDVSQVVNMLALFHKLGALFYLDSCQALMDVVTLDIAWLIEAIGKVIRDPALHRQRIKEESAEIEKRHLHADSEKLLSHGIASIDLLQFLWGKHENTVFLLELLQKTMLLSPWNNDEFLIPSLVPSNPEAEERLLEELKGSEKLSAKFEFKDSPVPDGIFERVVCLMLTMRNNQNNNEGAQIFKSFCKVTLDEGNEVWLSFEFDKITVSFHNPIHAKYNRQILDKMLQKIRSELSIASFTWSILLQDPEDGSFVPIAKAHEVRMKPWYTNDTEKIETEEFNLNDFIDNV